jgi:hypothetical protein
MCAAMVVAAIGAKAQPRTAVSRTNDTGNVEFYMSNNGTFGFDAERRRPGFIVPRGSTTAYMFGAGLWFGTLKRVGADMKKCTFLTYNPNSGKSWATAGPYSDSEFDLAFYNSVDYDRNGRWKPLTTPITQSWPLWLRPGMTTTPLTPGLYEPEESRRTTDGGTGYSVASFMPGVFSQIVLRYSDKEIANYEITDPAEQAGYPFGLEVQQSIYSWDKGRYKDAVVLQYEVINKSQDTLVDCVMGQASDPDLGTSDNDYISFYQARPDLRTAYAWTDSEADDYLTLILSVIEAPQADAAGRVDNTNRLNYYMAGRVAGCPAWTHGTDPKTSTERYDFLNGGTFVDHEGPGDQRALMASNTFTMYPGDTAHFAVLYAVAPYVRGSAGKHDAPSPAAAVDNELEKIVSEIFADYYGGGFNSVLGVPAAPAPAMAMLGAVPNPAGDEATIGFELAKPSSVRVRVVDVLGRTLLERNVYETLAAGYHPLTLDLRGLAAGTYFAIIDAGSATNATPLTIVR